MADLQRYGPMQFIGLMFASGVRLTVINGRLYGDGANESLPIDEQAQLLERKEQLIPYVIRWEQDMRDKQMAQELQKRADRQRRLAWREGRKHQDEQCTAIVTFEEPTP